MRRYKKATKTIGDMEKKLVGLSLEAREKMREEWEAHLKNNSYGTCSSDIWSQLPEGYDDVTKYHLLQAAAWRFL